MRLITRSLMACTVGLLCLASISAAEKGNTAEKKIKPGIISLTKGDVDLYIGGKADLTWKFFDKMTTLQRADDDQWGFWEQVSNLDFFTQYGRQKYDKSAVDSFLRIKSKWLWGNVGRHTPLNDSSKDTEVILPYVNQAWINVHLGTFVSWLKNHPVSIKAGYFPYMLGRGVSMGGTPMHIPHLGWDSGEGWWTDYYYPGVLLRGHIADNITYDLYYSQQSEKSDYYTDERAAVWANRTDGRSTHRGIRKDRDLFTAKMDLSHESKEWGMFKFQPYAMYLDSPENLVEYDRAHFTADSSVRLGTVGVMADYKHKGLKINIEAAGQFGHQQMYAIDRDTTEAAYDTSSDTDFQNYTGIGYQKHTHIFMGDTDSDTDAPTESWRQAPHAGTYINDISSSEGTDYNGELIGSGVAYQYDLSSDAIVKADKYAYNSNFYGNKRFRDGYRIDYRGFMVLGDASYKLEEYPVKFAVAAGYISGDSNPYNTEVDKRSRTFIPYGDSNYNGNEVKSYVVLKDRYLSRPTDFSYRRQAAEVHWRDSSNLQLFGFGTEYKPFKDDSMVLASNVICFWAPSAPKKWNKDASALAEFSTVWGESTAWDKGWMSTHDASNYLGTEVNLMAHYEPVEALSCKFTGGIFFPGGLYKDIEGMPTVVDNNHVGLGHEPVISITLGVKYLF
jgi:hypothetical protein